MLSHQVKLNPPTRCSQRISHAAGVFHIYHVYIDGTKIVANANKYSWVWKNSCIKNRQKVFEKVSNLLNEINKSIIYQNIKFEIRSEYAIEYLEEITAKYIKIANININNTVKGRVAVSRWLFGTFQETVQ